MKYLALSVGVLLFMASACTFETSSSSEETSLSELEEESDVKVFESGLSCEKSYMSKGDEKFKQNVTFGENIQMNFLNIEGLKIVDDAIRADVMFLFTKLNGDTVMFIDYGEIVEQDFEIPNDDNVVFNVFTPITYPVYSGEKYIFRGGFKDVRTGKSLEGETTLKVNPNYNVEINASGMTYKEIYLVDNTQNTFILDQNVRLTSQNEFVIREIDGFNLVDGNAMIGASLLLTNDKDEEILNLPDLAKDMPKGMPYSEIGESLVVDFTIGSENVTTFANVSVKIWDKNGDGYIEISTRVNVID